MAQDATIISASLNDRELKQSIDNLVNYVDAGTKKMAQSMTDAVAEMKKSLLSLGNLKIDYGGSASGNVVSKLKKDSKEISMTLDQTAQILQKKASGNTIIDTYDTQLALLKEDLKNAESQMQSFLQMSRRAGEVGNEGLFKFATTNLHEQESEIERLKNAIAQLQSQRDNIRGIMQPQGDSIKNYIQDLQRANPELALLNQQYKRGIALLQQKGLVLRKSAQEEQQNAKESAVAQQKLAEYVSQSVSRQESFTKEIIKTGLAAQQTARNVMASINEQMASGSGKQVPVDQIYELLDLFKKMNSAYYSEGVDRESPIYKSLMKDLDAIREVIKEVSKYNNAIFKANLNGGVGVTQRSTVESLRKEISSLTSEYNKMTIAQINAGKADDLIKNFQNANRAAQVLQKTLSRPIDLKSAMGLQARTLDEIAYKMQMLSSYRENLNIFDPKQKSEIEQVNAALKDLEKTQNEILGRNKSMMESNNALARSFNYMKNRLAFYFTVGASTAFVKNLIEIRSQYELAERSLGILIRSAERGSEVFKQLSDMSLISPYTLIELTNAARQLTAYGVAAKDVVDTTRRLADISAAVGAPVERIAYALGHVQSYGYLTSLQARQFANNGIPLVKELADRYSELEGRMVTTADVYDRMKKKQVEYADVIAIVNKMTDEGGRFYDFQAKQAETLKVQLANLNLAWNNMLNDMGKDNQGLLTGTISALKSVFLAWKDINKAIWDVIWTIGIFKGLQFIVLLFGGGLKEARGWSLLLGKSLQKLAASAMSATAALATNPLTWVVVAVTSLVSLTRHVLQVKEAAIEMNREIAKSAKETSDSMDSYLSGDQIKQNRRKNKEGVLSSADATKTWETLREQIELSSDNSDVFISKLLEIENTSERLTAAFDIADKIQEATSKLSGLNEEAFKVSQDSWLYGLFGEGLGEDLDDYISDVFRKSNASKLNQIFTNLLGGYDIFDQQAEDEAKAEMEKLAKDLADVLRDRLGADVNDETILSESIERIRKIIKDKNPQIKGEVANFFDVKLDELLGKEFEGVYNKQTSLQRGFLNILKRDYGTAFDGITDNILKENAKWGQAQINAIKKAAEAYKKITVPEFHSAIDDMVRYMNSQDWRIRIAAVFNVNDSTKFQQEFDKRVGDKFGAMLLESYRKYRPKKDQDLYEWADANAEALDNLRKELKSYSKDSSEYSKERKREILDEINERTALANIWNQTTTKNKNKSKKDPVLDSLKTEISLVEKLQGDYEKLTKAGASSKDALKAIHNAYGSTIDLLNKNLQGFGLPRLDLSMITGKNPNEQLNYFKELKSLLESKGLSNLERIKALDAVIEKLNVKAETYNLDMVTKGLNNELGKLKEEYELGVEFDANPELGDVFADMIGIDKDTLKELPRTFEQFVEKAQERINKLFEEKGIDLKFNLKNSLNLSNFDDWVTASGQTIDSQLVKELRSYVEQANKIRLDETKKQIDDWNKLLEKYAQYEYKKLQIEKEYQREMEVARGKKATSDLTRAITNKKDSEIAKVNFEKFQQSPTWIAATGDLATMTSSALGLLIKRIEEYKRTANNLSDKEIKSINNALRKLHQQQRRENPFLSIKASMEEAKQLYEDYQEKIDDAGYRVDELNAKRQKELSLTEAETNELSSLNEQIELWKQEQEAVGKVSLNTVLQGLSKMKDFATSVTGAVGDIFAAFGDEETQEVVNGVTSALDKATQFAAMGAQVGGVWGAAAGAAFGLFSGLVSSLGDILSGNRAITKQIQESERSVKRLQNAYKDLEQQVEEAYGAMIVGAQRAEIANKKAQLDELKRQLELERSRNSKYYDEEKIIDLQGQIKDLENEISEMTKSIVTDLLGISSVGDAAEQLVSSMIDAFRKGEDYMIHFDETFEDMIDNMIMKAIVSRVIGDRIQNLFDMIDQRGKDRAAEYANDIDKLTKRRQAFEDEIEEMQGTWSFQMMSDADKAKIRASWQKTLEDFDKRLQELQEAYANAMAATPEDVESVREYASNMRDSVQSEFEAWMAAFGIKYGEGAEGSKLSNLQQGIQGITEDTAGALEAYMNGVSQQVYLHSDLLTQIRDTLVGFDMDVQTATQAQILLQLQQSYAVQMSIQSMLQGWSNASGMAVRVEMI